MSTHEKFNSGLWQCEACGAWLDSSDAVPGSWHWTGTAWEHGGHANMPPQAGHFPARFFATIADAIAHATATLTAERDAARAARVDDPDLDATDGAHPAWWRGHDHVARQFAERVATLTQERDEARAERRAARLDRDAAEERVAELTAALWEYAPECSECTSFATFVFYDDVPWFACDVHRHSLPGHGGHETEHAAVMRLLDVEGER